MRRHPPKPDAAFSSADSHDCAPPGGDENVVALPILEFSPLLLDADPDEGQNVRLRRRAETARHHGGVRGDPPQVGHETRKAVLLEQHHVGRGDVMGHDDQLFLVAGLLGDMRGAGERLEHPLHHLHDVVPPLAKVRVLDGVELRQQGVGLRLERPFGIAALGLYELARDLRQRGVIEDHQVQVEEGVEFLRRIGRDLRAQIAEFVAHGFQRGIETREFAGNLFGRHVVVRDLQFGVRHQMRVSDGDAAGHRDAVHGEAHGRLTSGVRSKG